MYITGGNASQFKIGGSQLATTHSEGIWSVLAFREIEAAVDARFNIGSPTRRQERHQNEIS